MTPIFRGKVAKGKIVLDTPQGFEIHKGSLEGKWIELILRKQKSQRSLPQNDYYWAVIVEMLAKKSGYEKDEMHEALKIKFASCQDINGLTKIESTAKMTTDRFIEYCDQIKRWSAEFLSLNIPDPNQTDY